MNYNGELIDEFYVLVPIVVNPSPCNINLLRCTVSCVKTFENVSVAEMPWTAPKSGWNILKALVVLRLPDPGTATPW